MSETRKCMVCGQIFKLRAQCPHQRYCSNRDCQRERKAQWQKLKVKSDPDYRENQRRAQTRWSELHPDYWRRYRDMHQAYKERNREQQRVRNSQSRQVAKMDVSVLDSRLCSGLYVLTHAVCGDVAKIGAWIVHLTVISDLPVESLKIAKR
ncbi:hypothetical protein [Paraburkholderia youngii]|uniref:Uncharacterized protein n=1 Tax=Paraburkholderia youngii TaxID=2782701 RepID=A0A7W8L9L2_9BURK|nr:hypothetical protein [Paraburkholderia youngii]MBB5402623.1 hypothetical protein [Paraburkholderia youngii]